MEANLHRRDKPAPLTVQVMHAERQVLTRRRLVRARSLLLGHHIRNKLTSPSTLLIVGGVGFAIGLIPKRKGNAASPTKPRTAAGSATTMYARALNLIALAKTLSGFFPSSTPDASVQSVVPREAPEAQYRSADPI